MGNQPSKPPSRSTTHHEKDEKQQRLEREKEREKELERNREREREREKDRERRVNRRISFQALSHGKATAADPSATTASALAQTISQPPLQNQNLQQHLQATQSHSPDQSAKSAASADRSISPAMVYEEQKERGYRPKENPVPVPTPVANAEPSIPMDVPGSTTTKIARDSREESAASKPSPPALTPQYTPISSMIRPPRLPLAIADEVRAPDSPPLEPAGTTDEEISIFDDEEAELPRKNSTLSSATADDEDVGHELQPYAVDTGGVNVVPTRIDWKGDGERVYVTGTFAHWDRKFRLHPRYEFYIPLSKIFAIQAATDMAPVEWRSVPPVLSSDAILTMNNTSSGKADLVALLTTLLTLSFSMQRERRRHDCHDRIPTRNTSPQVYCRWRNGPIS